MTISPVRDFGRFAWDYFQGQFTDAIAKVVVKCVRARVVRRRWNDILNPEKDILSPPSLSLRRTLCSFISFFPGVTEYDYADLAVLNRTEREELIIIFRPRTNGITGNRCMWWNMVSEQFTVCTLNHSVHGIIMLYI